MMLELKIAIGGSNFCSGGTVRHSEDAVGFFGVHLPHHAGVTIFVSICCARVFHLFGVVLVESFAPKGNRLPR